jgi:hypothetical protein
MKNLLLLITIILFLQCGFKSPKPIKPDVERFFKVYDALMTLIVADSSGLADRSALLDSALQLCSMSQAQFDTTLAFLEKHPDLFIKAMEEYEKKTNPDSTKSEK